MKELLAAAVFLTAAGDAKKLDTVTETVAGWDISAHTGIQGDRSIQISLVDLDWPQPSIGFTCAVVANRYFIFASIAARGSAGHKPLPAPKVDLRVEFDTGDEINAAVIGGGVLALVNDDSTVQALFQATMKAKRAVITLAGSSGQLTVARFRDAVQKFSPLCDRLRGTQ